MEASARTPVIVDNQMCIQNQGEEITPEGYHNEAGWTLVGKRMSRLRRRGPTRGVFQRTRCKAEQAEEEATALAIAADTAFDTVLSGSRQPPRTTWRTIHDITKSYYLARRTFPFAHPRLDRVEVVLLLAPDRIATEPCTEAPHVPRDIHDRQVQDLPERDGGSHAHLVGLYETPRKSKMKNNILSRLEEAAKSYEQEEHLWAVQQVLGALERQGPCEPATASRGQKTAKTGDGSIFNKFLDSASCGASHTNAISLFIKGPQSLCFLLEIRKKFFKIVYYSRYFLLARSTGMLLIQLMSTAEFGNLPHEIRLVVGRPYMITHNIDVVDRLATAPSAR
ncbi:hypothetical protein MRX96_031775 [Rhipicephalus microplus]